MFRSRPLVTVGAATLAAATVWSAASAQSPPPSPSGTPSAGAGALAYPQARRSDHVDNYFGTSVPDPYRWLEDVDSPETKAWVTEENALTARYLAAIPERAKIAERLKVLWNYPKYGIPIRRNDRYFFLENSGLQNQSVLYVQDGLEGARRFLLDPNTLSADGTVALGTWVPSDDGRLLGYGVSVAGSDWEEIHVRDVATGRDLPDTLKWAKFTNIAWTKDTKGFFYSRFPEPKTGNALINESTGQTLYYHKLGEPQAQDRLIWQRLDQPEWYVSADVTEDGQFAIIDISQGTDPRNRLSYIDLGDPIHPTVTNEVVPLVDAFEAEYHVSGARPGRLFVRTDLAAPRGRLIEINLDHPSKELWQTLVGESPDELESAELIGGHFVLTYLHDAQAKLTVHAISGADQGPITLPGIGDVLGVTGRDDRPEAFFAFASYTQPTSIYRVDVTTRKAESFRAPHLAADVSAYSTEQIFCRSKDGTRVPVFVTARKGVALDGNNPTLLYAYGGFNITELPRFSPRILAWLELGGIYADAVLRGGGEYGTAWHEAGMFERKQNVFDDFIGAAQCLIDRHYTSTPRLAIQGESNGGLLVGAVMTQRPDLFGATLPGVGVMDMLRYQKFTLGWGWKAEYGSSDDSAQFQYLIKYSPLQNLKPGTKYPATLVMTSDHDDRVVPGHSFKFGATLQADQAGPAPVLVRIETRAGHGAGKPTSKQIDLAADELSFLVKNLGMAPPTI
jgi:prolyl oligopeptidase